MKTEEDLIFFDDTEAIQFILSSLPEEAKATVTEDKIEYVLDAIYDFYDDEGLIDEDTTESAEIDEEDMFVYLQKCIEEDKMEITNEEINYILEGEYAYGKSIGIYE